MANTKTILIFSAFYDPWISGAERFAKEIVERLAGRYRFVVVTALIAPHLPRRESRAGYEIVRLGFGTPADKWFYPLFAAIYAWRMKPDLAHAVMESYAGIALWLAGFICPRIRRLLTLQSGDLDSDVKQKKIPGWLWRRIHRSPDRVTAISRFLADRAIRLGAEPARVTVVPNGVDLSSVAPRQEHERIRGRIVCVARLSWEKGIDDLLRALALVRRAHPEATLQLVGGGALRRELEGLAAALGVADAVTFHGALPNAEALSVVKTADVFVCPSLAEGLGIVFIEAQACGVPVIGTRVGGIPDVIEDQITGLTVPPANPAELAAALRRLLSDRALADRLVAAARGRLPRFDWQVIALSVADIYNRLTAAPRMLIAASIYPPDTGGPATHAAALVERWIANGSEASVVVRRRKPLLTYFFELLRAARRFDVIFVQDASATALAASVVARISGRPLVARLGGDLLWERATASGATETGLQQYYASGAWRRQDPAYRFMLRTTLRAARRVVFPNRWLPDLYQKVGMFNSEKAAVIQNPIPEFPISNFQFPKRQILISGRYIPLKNIRRVIEVCSDVRRSTAQPFDVVMIGDGPLAREISEWKAARAADWLMVRRGTSRDELLEEMRRSLATVLISWSEVSPNAALESLALGTPTIVTRENGNRELLQNFAYLVDPFDDSAIRRAIADVVSDDGQRIWRERVRGFTWPQTYQTMMNQYRELFQSVCGY